MKKLLIALLALPVLMACRKSDEIPADDKNLYGRYMGTFYRSGGDTVNVSLLFTGNQFSGNSDRAKYPAICNGTFSLVTDGSKGIIRFDDNCVWAADFDWSLILEGDYEINFNKDHSVTIVRHHFASSDYYTLWKAVR